MVKVVMLQEKQCSINLLSTRCGPVLADSTYNATSKVMVMMMMMTMMMMMMVTIIMTTMMIWMLPSSTYAWRNS